MTMVPFPSRSKKRDYKTDRERFDKLSGMVKGLCDEIAYEAAVLFERHAEVMVTAGLPLPDFEDGNELQSLRTSTKTPDRSCASTNCWRRSLPSLRGSRSR